jgi:SnoaL-like domain
VNEDTLHVLTLRQLIENWVIWRDSGDWERFRTIWHDDGRMMATWFQGTADEFIQANREGWSRGVVILHFLGGTSVEVTGHRAVAQSKMTISQRDVIHGTLCDVVCAGRFYDLFENRNGRWGMVLRQPIYEKDRLDPVDPSKTLTLDPTLLAKYSEGYRHLAYLQTSIGYRVKTDMPGLKGAEVEAPYRQGKEWLAGGPLRL